MAKLPLVAIIGRPNTGKSTLFNRLIGGRRAIVSDIPGTTRDHVSSRVEGDDVDYLLVDTGGMGGGTEDEDFEDNVHSQSLLALAHADLILFLVNSREELTAADYEVVDCLRKKRKKHVSVFLIITKCDNPETVDVVAPQFGSLAIAEKVIPISAFHGVGVDELENSIEESLLEMHFARSDDQDDERLSPRVAVVGRPNVGKSSLVNALMSDPQRNSSPLLVSDVPGTTRDSTDTTIRANGKEYLFIDTAGLRRQTKVKEEIEAYSVLRTLRAIEEADVTILTLDATQEIAKQDKHIAGLAIERGSGLIICVNKIDLLDEESLEEKKLEVKQEFPFCRWAPVVYCCAKTRKKLPHLFEHIDSVHQNRARRITTSDLNRWYNDVLESHQGTILKGGRVGGKYLTQVTTAPPAFTIFCKDPTKLRLSTLRYMENRLRETFAFEGTPVLWYKRGRDGD